MSKKGFDIKRIGDLSDDTTSFSAVMTGPGTFDVVIVSEGISFYLHDIKDMEGLIKGLEEEKKELLSSNRMVMEACYTKEEVKARLGKEEVLERYDRIIKRCASTS